MVSGVRNDVPQLPVRPPPPTATVAIPGVVPTPSSVSRTDRCSRRYFGGHFHSATCIEPCWNAAWTAPPAVVPLMWKAAAGHPAEQVCQKYRSACLRTLGTDASILGLHACDRRTAG